MSPNKTDKVFDFLHREYSGARTVGRFVAEETTDTLILPFSWMLVLAFKLSKLFRRMAFETVLSRFDGQMRRRIWRHRFGFVLGGEVIKAADYDNDDEDKEQVARFHG
jgi:hypothetical protein